MAALNDFLQQDLQFMVVQAEVVLGVVLVAQVQEAEAVALAVIVLMV
jgi:hypothetical protein